MCHHLVWFEYPLLSVEEKKVNYWSDPGQERTIHIVFNICNIYVHCPISIYMCVCMCGVYTHTFFLTLGRKKYRRKYSLLSVKERKAFLSPLGSPLEMADITAGKHPSPARAENGVTVSFTLGP